MMLKHCIAKCKLQERKKIRKCIRMFYTVKYIIAEITGIL